MLKAIGLLLLISAAVWTGSSAASHLKVKTDLTGALITFTEHIRASIYTSRLPLAEIFSSFSNDALEKSGFVYQLRQNNLRAATTVISGSISKDTENALIYLSDNLGGIDPDSQIKICEHTIDLLRAEEKKQKEMYAEKLKLCRSLPILVALSVIILTV